MNESQQVDHLANEIDRIIARFRAEYDMTYAAVIGVLEMKKAALCQEAVDVAEDQEESPSE